ncbi:DUF4031 domain-containing protein [Nostoc sp. CHAB 5834]|nr:DUF4031 domain-containing protein [Nostoc sp. CHAB 5834]
MTVYVDALMDWGWKLRGHMTKSCHMFSVSTDLEELHQVAQKIGMKREWFQPHRVAPHYDLNPARRADALKLGVVELGRKESSKVWAARRAAVAGQQTANTTAR